MISVPDRDLTEDEIRQACRHYFALHGEDPDVDQDARYIFKVDGGVDGGMVLESPGPRWKLMFAKVAEQHSLNRVLQKVYQDAERSAEGKSE